MTDSTLLQSATTFAVSAALAAYVALQAQRTPLHHIVMALLGAFMAWTAGVMLIFGSGFDPLASRIGSLVVYAGVMGAAPLWLFLCLRVVGASATSEQPRAVLLALCVPSALTFAALATDPWHGGFAGGATVAMFTEPVPSWAGPFFWVHAAWAYLCTGAGIGLCVRAARRSGPIERRRYALVALAAAVPLISGGIVMAGLVAPDVRLTPADLGVSALLMVTAIVRYRFLEPNRVPARDVISHLAEALLLADDRGTVVDANPAAQQLLGQGIDSLRGRPLDSVLSGLAPQLDRDAWRAALDAGSPAAQTVVTADERVLDLSYARVFDRGRASGSFLIARDRTEQHRVERSRHQTQRLESLGVLVAGIAHEINNPLAFVRTNLSHLNSLAGLVEKRLDAFDPPDATALSEMAEVILETQGGVDRISRIVEATRRLSRAPRAEREIVDLNAVVEGAIRVAALHSNRSVALSVDLDPAAPRVRGSAEQLGQVVLNLLINAKQATERVAGGHIRVETRLGQGRAEVRIHDNGPGVEPADRDSIFDPFFTTKGPDEGTGLGLAIAFDIVKDHDGSLEVGVSELGGARFSLVLGAVA